MTTVARMTASSGLIPDLLRNMLVAAVYYLAGEAGLRLALVGDQVTPLWPCTGIALVALFYFGPHVIPGIALGAFLVNLPLGPSPLALVLISAGNTLAPVVAWALLRRVDFRIDLRRFKDALALVFLGGLGGMLVSATVGSLTLLLAGALPEGQFWGTWLVWWTGDTMGVLLVAPLLFLLASPRPKWTTSPIRWLEAGVLIAGSIIIAVLLLVNSVHALFSMLPFLVWATVRFQLSVAMPCAVTSSLIATMAAVNDIGPFAHAELAPTMVTLQTFNGSLALTVLLLAAVISERDEAKQAVEDSCRLLADTVTSLGQRSGIGESTLEAVRRATKSGNA